MYCASSRVVAAAVNATIVSPVELFQDAAMCRCESVLNYAQAFLIRCSSYKNHSLHVVLLPPGCRDLIELRNNRWVPRRAEEKAKTMQEVTWDEMGYDGMGRT